jgi:hypothetical protein
METPAPDPCAQAAQGRAEARRAFDAGRLLLARRILARAAKVCPAEAGAGRELSFQAALALGDTAVIDAERRAVEQAADTTPALRVAVARPAARYGGDVPAGLAASTRAESDYRAAARAFLDGKLDEAWWGALRVALAGGDLDAEAFVLAARVAEARHDDDARARRMYARAYQAECRDGCEDAVQPPDTSLAAIAVAHAGLRPFRPSCVNATSAEGSEPPEALSPDGAFYLWGAAGGVQARALPSRVLVDWIDVKPPKPMVVCIGAEARWFFLHQSGPPDTLQLLPGGGGAPVRLRAPRPVFFLRFLDVLVAANGDVLAPDFEDQDGTRAWYRASPRAPSLRPLPALHGAYAPAVLPGGDLVGVADRRSDKEGRYLGAFARFDGTTGKLGARIAKAPESGIPWMAASPSGQAVYALVTSPRSLLRVDLASGVTSSVPIPDGEPVGVVGPTSVVVETHHRITLVDVSTGVVGPAGAVSAPPADTASFGGPGLTVERDGDVLRLTRKVGDRYPMLRLRLAPGGKGGFAIDEKGYYEIFGEGAETLRRAAACHGEHPLDVCADRWEEPGLVEKFRRGDLSYRDP